MRVEIGPEHKDAETYLPTSKDDGSGVGINYADAYIKPIKLTLEDGRKITCKRRGLKLTFSIGAATGDGLLRRLEHGPDVRDMLQAALREAAGHAGGELSVEDGILVLTLPD